jgi:hypothetical protein
MNYFDHFFPIYQPVLQDRLVSGSVFDIDMASIQSLNEA